MNIPIYLMSSEIARHAGYDLTDKDKESVRKKFLESEGNEDKLLLGNMDQMTKMRMSLIDVIQNEIEPRKEKESRIRDFDLISTKVHLAELKFSQNKIKNSFYNGPANVMSTPNGPLGNEIEGGENKTDFEILSEAPGRDVVDFTTQDAWLNALVKNK